MAGKVILQTERLVLREFVEDDAAAVYRFASDPLVTRYTRDGLGSVEEARATLRAGPLADYQKYGYGRWASALPIGEVIGFCGLKCLQDLGGEVDVGYRFLPAYWGAGLATEAARAVIAYGLDRLGMRRILGLVDPENKASIRVLQKCGLVFEELFEYRKLLTARYAIHCDTAAAGSPEGEGA
jgi:RimJ/RimL family protein N-acetyltransferase